MFYFESNFVTVASWTSSGSLVREPLLHFSDITYEQRNGILLEIQQAHSQIPLTSTEIEKLKALKLLTKNSGEVFAG